MLPSIAAAPFFRAQRSTFAALALAGLIATTGALPATASLPPGDAAPPIAAAARADPATRVIVELERPVAGARLRSATVRGATRAGVALDARRLGALARATGGRVVWHARLLPAVVLDATPATMRALAASPIVRSVTRDRVGRLLLDLNYNPWPRMLGLGAMIADGHVGAGQTIAIVDSGVLADHDRLAGRLVAEACFASGFYGPVPIGDCPNGIGQQVGPGSAVPCAWSQCDHGTKVAGVAVGRASSEERPDGSIQWTTGVAPAAQYLAIRVTSRRNSQSGCGSQPAPCAVVRMSDVIRSLDFLLDWQLDGPGGLTAVNLSLGQGVYRGACDTKNPTMTQAIELLGEHGVAVVAASGNEGMEGLTYPSCVSAAISVGGADDFNEGRYNWSTLMDLAGPGSQVYTTKPPTGMGYISGTSAAAPFVAGAIAALRSRFPNASQARMLTALQTTGRLIRHRSLTQVGRKPRIRIHKAAEWLGRTTTTASASALVAADGGKVTLTIRVRAKLTVGSKPTGRVRLQQVGSRGSWTLTLDGKGRASRVVTITGSPRSAVRFRISYPGDDRFEQSQAREVAISVTR